MPYNIDKIIQDSVFIKEWKKQVQTSIQRINPDWSEDEIDEVLNKMIKENLQLPIVTLDNNYTGESRQTNLLSVFDWSITRRPIVAGNATFYMRQDEKGNPIAIMLDNFLKERKRLKKLMFAEPPGSDKYNDLDRGQLNGFGSTKIS